MCKPLLPLLICLITLSALSSPGWAATGGEPAAKPTATHQEANALLARVEKSYAQFQSLECSFHQRSKSGVRIREGSGQAFFFRPDGASGEKTGQNGVIRWEYHAPEVQTIINDGQELRIYNPADKQLLISSAAAQESDLTYTLLTGQASLSESFTVSVAASPRWLSPAPSGLTVLHLVPNTPQSQLKYAQIGVNSDLRIERLLMEDHFNAVTELSFSAMRFDGIEAMDRARIEQLRTLKTTEDTETIRH